MTHKILVTYKCLFFCHNTDTPHRLLKQIFKNEKFEVAYMGLILKNELIKSSLYFLAKPANPCPISPIMGFFWERL